MGVGLSPERIRKALATLGATPEALKRVYLIHHYPDHVGCLPGVQQRASNVEVVASEHEAEIISGKRGRDLPSNTLLRYLSRYQKLLTAPVDRGGARGRARRGELSRDRYTGAHSWAHLAFAGRGWALFYQRRVRGPATQGTVGVYKAPCTDPPHAKRSAQKLLAEEFDVVVRSHGEPLYGGRTSGYRQRSSATTATYSKENSGECILKSTFERGTLYGEVILTREIDAF